MRILDDQLYYELCFIIDRIGLILKITQSLNEKGAGLIFIAPYFSIISYRVSIAQYFLVCYDKKYTH